MKPLEGRWKARYAQMQREPFVTEEGGDDEAATIVLSDGMVSGQDPFGGEYSGTYSVQGEHFQARVFVTSRDPTANTIFRGLSFPLELDLSGDHRSPDHFSAVGVVVGQSSQGIVINLTRERS